MGKFHPLPEPIRLQDLLNSTCTEKKNKDELFCMGNIINTYTIMGKNNNNNQ